MKYCPRCKRDLPNIAFYPTKTYRSVQSYCKLCKQSYRKENLANDRKSKREYAARAYAENPEKFRKTAMKHYHSHQKTIRPKKRAYDKLNGRKNHLKSQFGMTEKDYDNLFEKQKGKCAICKKSVRLGVDHCHKSKQVRGLLCHPCNAGLGLFYDSKSSLRRALVYLSK